MTIPITGGGSTDMAADDVGAACDSFQQFVITWTQPEGVEEEAVYLEDLLAAWLYVGMGIEATAASYDHFLQVVLCVIDRVLKGAVSPDYQGTETTPYPRRMVGLVHPQRRGTILTRSGYDRLVYQTLESRREEAVGAER